jgi:hypothetical protein
MPPMKRRPSRKVPRRRRTEAALPHFAAYLRRDDRNWHAPRFELLASMANLINKTID